MFTKILLAATLVAFGLTACGKAAAETDPVIRIVYNNIVDVEGFEGDWGFSCVIEGLEKTILFDTGARGKILMENFEKMGVDPESVDLVVLSHFHSDHVGGLEEFLESNPEVMVFLPNSFPAEYKDALREKGVRLVEVKGPMTICEGAFTTGEMGTMIVEQALVLKTTRGSLLITGCAHPGIVEIIERATDLGGRQVFFAMGGFHLREDSDEEMSAILERFHDLGVIYCGASHCTGDAQIEAIREAYGERYIDTGAGSVIDVSKFAWRPGGGPGGSE